MSIVFFSSINEDRNFAEVLMHRLKRVYIPGWEQHCIAHPPR